MTEHNIPANAEGLSIKSVIAPKLLAEAEAANKSASVAYAIINLCKAASEYLDDQPNYEGVKNLSSDVAVCLGHASEMVVDVMLLIENVIVSGEKS